MVITTAALASAAQNNGGFKYSDEKFADLQMLRYKVEGFENLSLKEKTLVYYLQPYTRTIRAPAKPRIYTRWRFT